MLEQRLESEFHAHYSPADHLQHLHDLRLVWASEIQRLAPVDRDFCALGIALLECSFLESANRIGHYEFDDTQLKTSQEVFTLTRTVSLIFKKW